MDISRAKKVVELTKGDRKILVTIYEGDQVSSCVTEEPPPTNILEFPPVATKQYCETCQCDDKTCGEWIEYLKGKGYQATEVELSELGLEESLPKFIEGREITIKPEVAAEVKPSNVVGEEGEKPHE